MIVKVSDLSVTTAQRLPYTGTRNIGTGPPTLSYDSANLYFAAVFYYSSTTAGYELSVHKISLSTKAIVGSPLEFSIGTSYNRHDMVLHTASSKLVIGIQQDTVNTILIQIATSTLTTVYTRLILSYSGMSLQKFMFVMTSV